MSPFLSKEVIARAIVAGGSNETEFFSHYRNRSLSRVRFAACLAMWEHDLTLSRIARRMKRDRSSVRNAIRRGTELCAVDPEFAALFERVRA